MSDPDASIALTSARPSGDLPSSARTRSTWPRVRPTSAGSSRTSSGSSRSCCGPARRWRSVAVMPAGDRDRRRDRRQRDLQLPGVPRRAGGRGAARDPAASGPGAARRQSVEITTEEVVPGDVMLLARGRSHLRRRRAAGRASSRRHVDAHRRVGPGRARRRVFAGTYVAAGTAEAVVTATGMAHPLRPDRRALTADPARAQPAGARAGRVTRLVALLAVGDRRALLRPRRRSGDGLTDRFVFAIGVIVAIVPEGLLPTVTLSLAHRDAADGQAPRARASASRRSRRSALTTVICTDKTGTLTAERDDGAPALDAGRRADVDGAGYAPPGASRSRRRR